MFDLAKQDFLFEHNDGVNALRRLQLGRFRFFLHRLTSQKESAGLAHRFTYSCGRLCGFGKHRAGSQKFLDGAIALHHVAAKAGRSYVADFIASSALRGREMVLGGTSQSQRKFAVTTFTTTLKELRFPLALRMSLFHSFFTGLAEMISTVLPHQPPDHRPDGSGEQESVLDAAQELANFVSDCHLSHRPVSNLAGSKV